MANGRAHGGAVLARIFGTVADGGGQDCAALLALLMARSRSCAV